LVEGARCFYTKNQLTFLQKYRKRHLVLLIDFDGQVEERTRLFKEAFPQDVQERVYLLGTLDEPEPLRRDRGVPLEKIGEELASACANVEVGLWAHPMLEHNKAELGRLVHNVKQFLFKG
jgi:hypothetical protein